MSSITLLLFGALVLFLALGLPLAFVLGGVGVVGCYFLWGTKGLFVAAAQTYGAMGKFTLLAIPLFVFMAMILERAGVADDLYTMMHRWMGPVRGGLAIGTVLICAIFAAMSGISATATVSMGIIALPAMLKRKYDKIMAMGCISGGGALGILIPPSVPMILYATLTGESIGGLFAGGIFPGLLLTLIFILYIGVRCFFQPHLGPALPKEERATWQEKFVSLKAVALPDRDHHHGPGVHLRGGLHGDRGRHPGSSGGIYLGGGLPEADLDAGQRVLLPHGEPHRHDRLDPHRRLLLHLGLHRAQAPMS